MWLRKALRAQQRANGRTPNAAALDSGTHRTRTDPATPGADARRLRGVFERNLVARLDYSDAEIHAFKDLEGKGLLNPKLRNARYSAPTTHIGRSNSRTVQQPRSVAEQWYALGLIDDQARPTRRGNIFSFFNHGEGLAVAAALEASSYQIEELLYDLANIRGGHRFNALAVAGRPLTALCQSAYGLSNIPGYLRRGLPEDYGEGASEILYKLETSSRSLSQYLDDELSFGDIERARVEWCSIRAHIATAPDYPWGRWMELKAACQQSLAAQTERLPFENLPPLTREQQC